ncbi:MAG: zinc ribbon domain-containing protein [Nanoarchaeota archaeon]|nr:zinc ribbon domain-containing protein [DPANN group archaeon]MBL7116835.1 zinc ribbon domain-containing protein [Nanoarchaeota archaeon]
MPFCSKCGFQADVDDSFCARCGAEIKYKGEKGEEFSVDWRKKTRKKKDSFWSIFSQSLRHTFFDSEQKLSKKRKIINIIILIAILAVAISIISPYLDSVKINIGEPTINNGECRYRLDARQISISEVKFFPENLTMEMLITNNKDEDIVIETLAKTYEFRFDNKGDTEVEIVSMNVPSGKTLKLSFSVRKEPYILGLEFSNCEKAKVSDWDTIYNS